MLFAISNIWHFSSVTKSSFQKTSTWSAWSKQIIHAPNIQSITVVPTPPVPNGSTLTITALATDPDGDALTYTWTVPSDYVIQSGQGTAEIVAQAKLFAAGSVSVTVDDGNGGSATDAGGFCA